ncbi:ribonuclease domain-containing protein [Wenjunlia tyrosinilytica]
MSAHAPHSGHDFPQEEPRPRPAHPCLGAAPPRPGRHGHRRRHPHPGPYHLGRRPRPDRPGGGHRQPLREALPGQAHDTPRLIDQDGPFPYPQDGSVFHNRERVLPSEPTGYYYEDTVRNPGSSTRGARRIITGDAGEDHRTADHYASFKVIDFSC